ncbi:MAG: helix-turn-helix domain-containing protein [Pseudomonadota bacterium]
MDTAKKREILSYLSRQGIPPLHSVPFLFRVCGISITKAAVDAGMTRNYFYKVLAGERNPTQRVREVITVALGIDPWEI